MIGGFFVYHDLISFGFVENISGRASSDNISQSTQSMVYYILCYMYRLLPRTQISMFDDNNLE